MSLNFIVPAWPAPANVKAIQTTRMGGVSQGVFASFNVGDHVGDDFDSVEQNRARVLDQQPGVLPIWMQQVHGVDVLNADTTDALRISVADAAVCQQSKRACVVMTADCLPVLFCDRAGTVVAAAHAGWRGLCNGVLENTVKAMACPVEHILAWLGPCIGPNAFEVGDEVKAAFVFRDLAASGAFVSCKTQGKWLANLPMLAKQRLARVGVHAVYGGEWCTYTDSARFFSYRRAGKTGRMASLIWLD